MIRVRALQKNAVSEPPACVTAWVDRLLAFLNTAGDYGCLPVFGLRKNGVRITIRIAVQIQLKLRK
jgi:hypothetical protein